MHFGYIFSRPASGQDRHPVTAGQEFRAPPPNCAIGLRSDAGRSPRLPLRQFGIVIAAAAGLAMGPADGRAGNLGFTPSHVYSMWESVNDSLVVAAGVASKDRAWIRDLGRMEPRRSVGKVPADVLRQVGLVTAKLNRLRRDANLTPIAPPNAAAESITPSDVFISSGRVLDGLAGWFIKRTGPSHPISPHYTRRPHSGKTPSDVFGMVDLADRRLARILVKLGK